MSETEKRDGRVDLVELADGGAGVVVEIRRGRGATARLDAMGIRPGVKVAKVSGFRMRGPVTVRVGRATVAVGHGMASAVIVDEEK